MKKRKPEITFPVLWDTKLYKTYWIGTLFARKRVEILLESKKGYFNYDTNKFEIPEKDFAAITNNPRLRHDFEIIKQVGYKVI